MRRVLIFAGYFLLVSILISSSGQSKRPEAILKPPTAEAQVLAIKNLPVDFIPNAGQTDSRVNFYVKGSRRTVYFTPDGVTLALYKTEMGKEPLPAKSRLAPADLRERGAGPRESWVVKIDFVGARKDVVPEGQGESGTIFSYFKGGRSDWRTSLPGYRRIIYRDLWPGVDLVYKGDVGRLKYEFIMEPGADPGLIQLGIRGASGVKVDNEGRLVLETPLERIVDEKPLVFQEGKDGKRKTIAAAYKVKKSIAAGAQVGFSLADYDRSLPLVIDPVTLIYCGYVGGGFSSGIAVDSAGNAYVTGYTRSDQTTFPVTAGPDLTYNGGFSDAFVAKINSSGTGLVYCGYIGGSGDDYGNGIAVDSAGNAYVTGRTYSDQTTFPVTLGPDLTHNGKSDAFAAKVNASGTGLVYCGYIGGSSYDYGSDIAVDGSGNAYVTGITDSDETSFPVLVGPDLTHNDLSDVFVAKVKASGTGLVYCGYIGGSGEDYGSGIAVDALGNAYVTGTTSSHETTFPVAVGPDLTSNGIYDAFMARIKANGSGLVYCGYIGGSDEDYSSGIAVDALGNAYVTGTTRSHETTFPVAVGPDLTSNGIYDAFVARIKANGRGLVYCGYIGGMYHNFGNDIAVDGSGNAYVTGITDSDETSFPVLVGPDLTYNLSVDSDPFVAKISMVRVADLSVSKSVDNIKPFVDDTVVFTITVTNLGPRNASGVKVADKLPAGLSFVSADTTQGTYDPASGLWTVDSLEDQSSATLTLRARVDKEGTITNTVTLAEMNESDPEPLNNEASVSLVAESRLYAPSNFQVQRLENDLIFFKEYVNRLSWAANPLNRSVIVKCRLYRKAKGEPDTAFVLYKEFGASLTNFDDRGLKRNDLFTYRLTSVNITGRESEPTEVEN